MLSAANGKGDAVYRGVTVASIDPTGRRMRPGSFAFSTHQAYPVSDARRVPAAECGVQASPARRNTLQAPRVAQPLTYVSCCVFRVSLSNADGMNVYG
jgi:hypothetical protein